MGVLGLESLQLNGRLLPTEVPRVCLVRVSQDYSTIGFTLGSPYFGKLPGITAYGNGCVKWLRVWPPGKVLKKQLGNQHCSLKPSMHETISKQSRIDSRVGGCRVQAL